MRLLLIALPILLAAVPARAAPAAAPQLPSELSDPAMADNLGRAAGVLTRSLMDLPIGELEAAIDGRPATPADRSRRVRDSINDPNLEQRVASEAARSGRTMQAATKALVSSLPAIMGALGQMEEQLERAVANLPDPTYPRR
jgi:hypothetical protein